MKFLTTNSLISFIQKNIDEAEIFSYYLDIPFTDIYKCINDKNYRVNNTLRNDNNPSLGFMYIQYKGRRKLYAKDFANPFFTGDCFYFAGISPKLKLNCNNPREFVEICKDIIKRFHNDELKAVAKSTEKPVIHHKPYEIKQIDIEKREFNNFDYEYWGKFGIRPETLEKENIYAVNKFWVDHLIHDYYYVQRDPCYAFYQGKKDKTLWEIYRPHAYNRKLKFRSNNPNDVKELFTIRPNTNLILTKAKKEKALIQQLLLDLNIHDCGVLYCSESIRLRTYTRKLLQTSYKHIYVNFDLDYTGVESMKFFRSNYGFSIFPFVAPNLKLKFYPKDIGDFCYRFGYDDTKLTFNYLYNKYVRNE